TELTNLGITTEYNVGDEYSSDTHLTDYHLNQVIHYDFDYNNGDENNSNSNYMKAWTAVTNIMTDIANTNTTKNVYFHCRVGADRTGTVAYLLEGLLGVPDEMRYEEYALTNVSGLYDRTRYYKQKNSTNNLKFVYMMGYVKTTQDIYNWYMQNPNASASLVQAFRAAMTVPANQQQQNSPQNAPVQNMSPMSANVDANSTEGGDTAGGDGSGSSNAEQGEGAAGTEDTDSVGSNSDSNGAYASPLGVSETVASTNESSTNTESPLVAGLVAAAVAVAATGAVAFAFSKSSEEEDKQ
ncbi:MAG: tyrosine-protein phosphatase, partial [Candidatus Saccharibacteria bacterium]|nr:tyrosine-protein phosphatase [Candidatus Saccharibacteria bacterium]